MSKANTGAKARKGERVKPVDNKMRGKCPCKSFLKCSGRRPYGNSIWGNPLKREEAMEGIAYHSEGPVENKAVLMDVFKKISGGNPFYKGLNTKVNGKSRRVLTMPEIDDGYITTHMGNVVINNNAEFTYFQKSLVARANLVRSGPVMMSNVYVGKKRRINYPSKVLAVNAGEYTSEQWSVDHIQTKAKGGCNRFCNAGVMMLYDNSNVKNANGPGCPCVDALLTQKENPADGQAPFESPVSNGVEYTLYECSTLLINTKKKKEGKLVDKLPDKPPGTIAKYPEICDLDDPRIWMNSMKKKVEDKVAKICH